MKKIVVRENTDIDVPVDLATQIKQMLQEEPQMPLSINNSTLSFQDYTVGSIQIGDYEIEIQPRNPVFTLEALFEMLLYESINNFDENYLSSGFGDNQSFGISSINSQFLLECTKLVAFGMTGGFVEKESDGKEVKGRIHFEKFHPAIMGISGLTYDESYYSYNVPANQIIKSAIIKTLSVETRPEQRKKYQSLLKYFTLVSNYNGSYLMLDDITDSFYSANPHYPLVLEFSIKILREMKTKYNNGEIKWNAFLHNSNDIFEKYVRKVLSKGLDCYVTKWESPKTIAKMSDGKRFGQKSFVPDILIDYNPLNETAKAVLDAKNKKFETTNDDIGEILSSADMYQMAFYCDKLKTNLGGLIYPAGQDFKPINVFIDGNQDLRFILFAINLKEKIGLRHKKICDQVNDYLLYYTK